MGQKRRNVEAVTDYADNRHFLRLHRDILLPAAVCEAVRRHLATGRWEQAKGLALEHAPADSHEEIELFFTSTADRLASDNALEGVSPAQTPAGRASDND
jgi:hypothetical protein